MVILWQRTAISDREAGNEPHLVYERFLLRGITLSGHQLPKKEDRLTVDSDAGVYCSRRPGIFPLWPNNIRAVVYPRYNFGESCSIIRAFTPKASIASSWIECDSMATQNHALRPMRSVIKLFEQDLLLQTRRERPVPDCRYC